MTGGTRLSGAFHLSFYVRVTHLCVPLWIQKRLKVSLLQGKPPICEFTGILAALIGIEDLWLSSRVYKGIVLERVDKAPFPWCLKQPNQGLYVNTNPSQRTNSRVHEAWPRRLYRCTRHGWDARLQALVRGRGICDDLHQQYLF